MLTCFIALIEIETPHTFDINGTDKKKKKKKRRWKKKEKECGNGVIYTFYVYGCF
jgi:hypothetical protein